MPAALRLQSPKTPQRNPQLPEAYTEIYRAFSNHFHPAKNHSSRKIVDLADHMLRGLAGATGGGETKKPSAARRLAGSAGSKA